MRFLGFGGSSLLLSLRTVSCCGSRGSSSVAFPCRSELSQLFSAISPTLSILVWDPDGEGLCCWSLAPAPPPPTAMFSADMLGWSLGIPSVALGFTIRLVETVSETLDSALLWFAPPTAPTNPADKLNKTWTSKMVDFQTNFVGRYSNHHPGP